MIMMMPFRKIYVKSVYESIEERHLSQADGVKGGFLEEMATGSTLKE